MVDVDAMMRSLRCTTFTVVEKREGQKAILVQEPHEEIETYLQATKMALRGDFRGLDREGLRFVVAAPDAHGLTYMWTAPGFSKGAYVGTKELHDAA